jgi:origin recognition complex subunit 5
MFIATSIPIRNFGALPLPTIYFHSYTKPELLQILNLHVPSSLYPSSYPREHPGDLEPSQLHKIWEGLNSAVIDIYGPGTSLDVPTILNISQKLWPRFIQPVIDEGCYDEESDQIIFGRVDFSGLFALGKRKGLFSTAEVLKSQSTFPSAGGAIRGGYELPYYAKYLLISAFLASFNPTRDDARIFSREAGAKRKVKRAGRKSNKGIAKVVLLDTWTYGRYLSG